MSKTISALATALAGVLVLTPAAKADTPDTAGYKEICRMLDAGASPDGVVDMLRHTYGGSLDGDRLAVVTAMYAYCPSHLPPPRNWDWTGR